MKLLAHRDLDRLLDVSAMVGLIGGTTLLLPSLLFPELRILAIPAWIVLLPSLLVSFR